MTHVHLWDLAARQDDVVAAWQLTAAGWTRAMIDHRPASHGWRQVHVGVYVLSRAPLTQRQRWRAATLTTPDSVLSHASAAACWGFRAHTASVEVVTRPGSGGRRQLGELLVCHSSALAGDVTRHRGLPVTTAARALIDLAPWIGGRATARAFREALRLRVTTIPRLVATLERHCGRRGTARLRDLCSRYAGIPYERTRSDAEALGLEQLVDAGLDLPQVNVRIAGEEADFVYVARKQIIEIDGPQFHRFRDEDERKARAWRRAGYSVRRVPSGAVYDGPDALLDLAR